MRRFSSAHFLSFPLFTFALAIVLTQSAQAQTFKILHNFTGGDGAKPYAGLTIDASGNLYGTTTEGGMSYGTVFNLTNKNSGWIFSRLYSFAGGNDGSVPQAGVIFGPRGPLYGTTATGGQGTCIELNGGCGTVFELTPSPTICKTAFCPWRETALYAFLGGCCDGAIPRYGDLIFDEADNLYGTTSGCDNSCGNAGTVYELALSNGGWMESVLYSFTGGNDGASPYSGVIFDKAGNLYGTTTGGGPYGPYGVVFRLTPSGSGWSENVLHAFNGDDGVDPVGGLILDGSGNLYGTTASGSGTVFELTPSNGGWTFSTIYRFPSGGPGPQASLLIDKAGNLYGTTLGGGSSNSGTVFKLTFSNGSWTETVLHDFTGASDGAYPYGGVVLDASGNLYGTASLGGTSNLGVVFEITP